MSSSKPSGSKTKRKIADEHRNFQEKWELEYFCSEVKDKIICLICNNAISVLKLYNIKRHYEQHKSKYDTYEESEAAVHASYVLSEMIAKHSKPFTEGDFIKECLIKVAEIVCPGSVKTFQAIYLSRNTVVERVTDMARNLNDQIKEKSSCFEAFSIACNETCDTDFNIFEELLELVLMHGTTTGEDIFNCVYDLLRKYNLPQSKLTSVATDGAPSMTGKTNGFVALLRKKLSEISDGSNIHHTRCIIHQEVLCTKIGPSTSQKIVNKTLPAEHCKRVTPTRYERLPNVASLSDHDDRTDLSSMIRQIVREEVQQALGSPREEPKIATIEEMVQEEIVRTLVPISKAIIDSADDTLFLEKCLFEDTPKNSSPLYSELEYRIEPSSIQLIEVASRDIPNDANVVAECRKELLLERELTAPPSVISLTSNRGKLCYTFERMIDNLLKGFKWAICLCYLVDIIVFSDYFRLCFRPDQENIRAVRDFATPRSLKEVRNFLGLSSYYRRLIPNYAHVAQPLNDLLKKDSTFNWNQEEQNAFEALKSTLISEPALGHFDYSSPTEIHTDASNYGIGAVLVLIQKGKERAIAYESRTLNKAEKIFNYRKGMPCHH
ncbi:hypothetical protein LAZ67_3001273 [Cordylochernes scorpioides]|uniref:Uncharacterized protein n=1 Tax=Cordylochernes scorpioides TaxID=51811 RepID=A0ABY6K7K2_9ARAC|nr:hypothetical protein LAZ67_3001273 [Cordylochernes scorpioides]